MDAVRIVPHQRKVRRGGLHRSERMDNAVRVNDAVRIRVLRNAPDADDGRILDPLKHRVHVGTFLGHGDRDQLHAEEFRDAEVTVVAGRGAEETQLAALGPRFGAVQKPVRKRRRDQVVHELQRRAAADDNLLGLHVQKLGKEPARRRNAGKIAVIADVHCTVKTRFAIGKHLQHIV